MNILKRLLKKKKVKEVWSRQNQTLLVNLILRLETEQFTVVLEKGDLLAAGRGSYMLWVTNISHDRKKITCLSSTGTTEEFTPRGLLDRICYSSETRLPPHERNYWMYLVGNVSFEQMFDLAVWEK